MEVVHVHAVLHDVVAVFAGLAVGGARLDAAARHPRGEAPRMVVATEIATRRVMPLAVVRPPEFAPPDHERVVEHPAGGEVGDERRGRLVGLLALPLDAARQAAVMVPVLVVELDETHAPLGQPPGEHAVRRERAGILRVGAVLLEHMGRLIGEVGHLRHARLHAEGHLVVGDPRRDLGVRDAGKLVFVQLPQAVEQLPAILRRHARGIVDVEHGIATGTKPHRLMLGRQKARTPEMRHQRLAALVLRDKHHERGQVVMDVAKAIVEPGADARPPRNLRAALHERHARAVVDALRIHRADEAELVGNLRRVREQFAEPGAAVAVLSELEWRANQRNRTLVTRHAGEPLAATNGVGQLLAALLDQQRLVVIEVELRRSTRLKQVDHPLGLRREMKSTQHAAGGSRSPKHVGQRHAAEPHAKRIKQVPPRKRKMVPGTKFRQDGVSQLPRFSKFGARHHFLILNV